MNDKKFIITNENVKEYVTKIANWIKQQLQNANAKGVVLGMSGGIDCSVVARLCQIAGINTHLVLMPYGENMKKVNSYEDAMELIDTFKFEFHIFNIKQAVDSLKIDENHQLATENLKPRIRMTYLYQYAQINGLLVIGTGNLSERTVGYFTKWGDGGCDLNPLANITKSEVYILAKYLKIPNRIITKKPSADLWEGQTDEDEMGITYKDIDNFILKGTSGNDEIDRKIKNRQEKNTHKVAKIPTFIES